MRCDIPRPAGRKAGGVSCFRSLLNWPVGRTPDGGSSKVPITLRAMQARLDLFGITRSVMGTMGKHADGLKSAHARRTPLSRV